MYDLIIIGLGPAGLTAAIYAGRYNLETLVIGDSPGGQVAESGRIENYPGFKRIEGLELTQKMLEQAKSFGAEVERKEVVSIKEEGKRFVVQTGGETYKGESIILATGLKPRKLGVPGEERLLGRGVSYCALCDAVLFQGKTVAMVGGGDSALDGALELAEHVKKIYLIHRRGEFRAKPDFVNRARKNLRIKFVPNTNVTQIEGKEQVEAVILDKPFRGKNKLEVEGVFIEIGNEPERKLPQMLDLELDENGFIKVDPEMRTNVPGVFAAGDVTTGSGGMKQIVCATSEGALAARSVYRHLRENENKD